MRNCLGRANFFCQNQLCHKSFTIGAFVCASGKKNFNNKKVGKTEEEKEAEEKNRQGFFLRQLEIFWEAVHYSCSGIFLTRHEIQGIGFRELLAHKLVITKWEIAKPKNPLVFFQNSKFRLYFK